MIEYLRYFFNPSHLFSLRPPIMQLRAMIILLALFVGLVICFVVVRVFIRQLKDGLKIKVWRKSGNAALVMGLLGMMHLFFTWQSITLLGARFWLLIWALVGLVWAGFIARYAFSTVPKLRSEIEHRRSVEKYLP